MCDDLDDWELESFSFQNINTQSEAQKKSVAERKLVEESDLAIAQRLFGNEKDETSIGNVFPVKIIEKPKKTISKQYENELKLKEMAKIKREKKINDVKHDELYGKCSEDEYSYYEDKFNN